jgi:hypothetical protein
MEDQIKRSLRSPTARKLKSLKEKCLWLISEGRFTQAAIANALGKSGGRISSWKTHAHSSGKSGAPKTYTDEHWRKIDELIVKREKELQALTIGEIREEVTFFCYLSSPVVEFS